MAKRRVLTSRDLSWLAEQADGQRDVAMSLVREPNGEYSLVTEGQEKGREVALSIKTPSRASEAEGRGEEIAARREISLGVHLTNPDKYRWFPEADVIFRTESAIEKFLFPYYASQRLLSLEELRALQDGFFKASPRAIALIHVPPSRTKLVRENLGDPEPVGGRSPFESGGPAVVSIEPTAGAIEGEELIAVEPLRDFLERMASEPARP